MDSRSESDGQESSDDNTLSIPHVTGDGSNGRPGLEGANSDAEDLPAVNGLPLDTSNRLETQGLGKFSVWCLCTKILPTLEKQVIILQLLSPLNFQLFCRENSLENAANGISEHLNIKHAPRAT